MDKLIVKSRPKDVPAFNLNGFAQEGMIKNYFMDTNACLVVKYFSNERSQSNRWNEEELIIENILESESNPGATDSSEVSFAALDNAAELAALYAEVFKLYPTPIQETDYIKKTMEEGTLYVYIREEGRIVSAASAEINSKYKNAELTDCATTGQGQGKGHMKKLLTALEAKLESRDIHCFYTIARAESYGMNNAFYQLGYTYGGRLIKNCFIYSGIEDMNVWYKNI